MSHPFARIHKESAIVEDYRVAIADKPTLETATGAKSINKPDVHLDNTKGDIRTKLFLSGRQGEVFVRLYAAQGSIELSIVGLRQIWLTASLIARNRTWTIIHLRQISQIHNC